MRIYDSNGNLQYSDILGELSFGKYVRNITIDNSSNSSSLTDYQILITVDTATPISAGKMRSDGGDIRFYDGTNNLSYWIEGGINTTSTRIWVKIPSTPANSKKIIQMYYGNPNLGSLSSGDKTFLFFDDFSGGLDWTNKWQSTNHNLFTVLNGILNITYLTNTTQLLQTKNTYTNFEVRAAMQNSANQIYLDFPINANYSNNDYIVHDSTTLKFYIDATLQGSASISYSTWYYHRVIVFGTSIQFITYTDSGWSNVLLSKSATSSLNGARYPSLFAYGGSGTYKVDFIYIKNYSSPEPTTSIGNEYPLPIRIR